VTELNFASLGLAEPLMQALVASGYTTPTPIQAQAIPPLLAGKDLLGLAETGTGKTAAFALPILNALSKIKEPVAPRHCRALILAPTRELAIQIGESIETYGKGLNLRHAVIFGGVGSRPQIRAMDRGVDILIATPGRLLDLMSTKNVNLSKISFLVLDEADRMLDMGFIRDVKRIVKEVPKVRQSLLFSATMPADITALAHEILHHPVRVEIARAGKTVDRIEQLVYFVDTKSKRAALAALLKNDAMSRVIVFSRTKHGADRVSRGLGASGVSAFAIHGNKSQNARQAALEGFRSGKVRVLVATDIAARGIDIDDITHVVNYDLPNIPESYVHRIGRTARAGATGIAIALCAPEERTFLRDIERLTRKPLTPGPAIEGLAEVTASLPPIPNKRGDEDDERPHFERGRGRVPQRRHMPAQRPATAWHQGDAPRPVEAGANAPRSGGRDDRGGRPQGDRPRGDRPQGDRARVDRPHGERRFDKPRGDRPQGDRPQGDRPQAARPHGDRPHGDRPQGDRPRSDAPRAPRPAGDRPWNNGPRSDSRPQGERRFDKPRGDRPAGDRPHGDRPRGDAPRGDRNGAPRPQAAGGNKPWENRTPRPPREGGSADRRDDRPAPRRDGPDARVPSRWQGDRPRGGDAPRRAVPAQGRKVD
jgi:ATP-dependent RNA helicase RhlE